MRVNEDIRLKGHFWLPANPDDEISGILEIVDGGKIELELIGTFAEKIENPEQVFLGRVAGKIEKYGPVVLEGCIWRSLKIEKYEYTSTQLYFSTVTAEKAFLGMDCNDEDPITAKSFYFSIEGIDEWVDTHGFSAEYKPDQNYAKMEYSCPKPIVLSLDNGMELHIIFDYRVPKVVGGTENKMTQKIYFQLVSKDKQEINIFISMATVIANFLVFATDKTVCIDEIFISIGAINNNVNSANYSHKIPIYYQSVLRIGKIPKCEKHNMVFAYSKIKSNAEEIINRWIKSYQAADSAFSLYFAVERGAFKYIESKFLELVRGLEAYHRWLIHPEDNMQFPNRLDELFQSFDTLLGTEDEQKQIISDIVEKRKYLTHYLHKFEPSEPPNLEYLNLHTKAKIIFKLLFLQSMGFTQKEIESIFDNKWSSDFKRNTLKVYTYTKSE